MYINNPGHMTKMATMTKDGEPCEGSTSPSYRIIIKKNKNDHIRLKPNFMQNILTKGGRKFI